MQIDVYVPDVFVSDFYYQVHVKDVTCLSIRTEEYAYFMLNGCKWRALWLGGDIQGWVVVQRINQDMGV
jgi:hypothetical protein